MELAQLYWREPCALLLALLPLLFVVLNKWMHQRNLLRFAEASLIPWITISATGKADRWPALGLSLGWICLSIALAGPRTVLQLPPDYQQQPATVMLVMDLSASMNARDVQPDRRGLAQLLLATLLAHGDETLAVGIVLFSGHAFSLLQPTSERAVLMHFIDSLNDIRLPTAGNAMADAIELATQSLLQAPGERYMLVLSDGDIEVAERNRVYASFDAVDDRHAIRSLLIGVGDTRPVSVIGADRAVIQFEGRAVLSRLEAQWLKDLASRENIQYLHYSQLLQQSLADLLQLSVPRADSATQSRIQWQEWFFIPLLCGVLCVLVSGRRNAQKIPPATSTLHSLALMAVLSMLLPGGLLIPAQTYATDQPLSSAPFDQQSRFTENFSRATACYRAGDYACAEQGFGAAAWLASDQKQRAIAVFNLANSYFFLADYDQAAVLYRDAELLGIAPELVAINRSYAESMQNSIRKQLDLIRQSFARAQWKAALNGEAVPTLQDFVSNDERLLVMDGEITGETFYRASQQAIKNEILTALGFNPDSADRSPARWIETERVLPRTTAGMLSRLFEMELGIPLTSGQPQLVEGKRKW